MCVTVGPGPGLLAYWPNLVKMLTVNCAGHLADVGCASLIWFNPCGLIGCKVDELCHNGVNGPCCLYGNLHSVMTAWLSSNGVAHVNKVTLHRVWLVLGWVTVRFNSQ